MDPAKQLLLVEVTWGAIDQGYFLFNPQGQLLGKPVIGNRLYAYTGDLVGDTTQEVVVQQVHDTAMSSYPITWSFYAASSKGLVEALTIAKSHSEGSKRETFMMLNEVMISERKTLRVETSIYNYDGDPDMFMTSPPPGAPAAVGEVKVYHFDPKRGVFGP